MEADELYELVFEATRAAIEAERGGSDMRISRRMLDGRVIFEDNTNKLFKEVPANQLFKKVTSVREKLRVLEQRINNHGALSIDDKAELQVYITRCYGSLTTFNFLFRDEGDKFSGQKT